MIRNIAFIFIILPIICFSQTNIRLSGFTNYDAWTHMDPFYLDEPNQDLDNFRPVEYDERITQIKLTLDNQLMEYWIGAFGVKIHFIRRWSNRKHTVDSDEYFAYNWPMTPYQTRGDYISYGGELYFGVPTGTLKPYFGVGGEFKIEGTTSTFIYIDNQTNAAANPYASIPVDEHVERRFGYYAIVGVDYMVGKFFIAPFIRLYFNEIKIDEKMIIHDQTDDAQFRPGIELGFIF